MAEVQAAPRTKGEASALGTRRPRRRGGIRIDMAPMVDVAFLLLIFFMVTTVFRRPLAMEVNMPDPDAKVEVPESNVMTVYVDADDSMQARMGTGELSPMTWPDLIASFEANLQANPQLIVLVKVHRDARYEMMVDMMDVLEEAKMERFSLVEMKEQDLELLRGQG